MTSHVRLDFGVENGCRHICIGWEHTSNLLKCLSAANGRIIKPAAVNHRENLKPVFFSDKNHKLSLIIFIDFQTIEYILIKIAFKSL